jgi:small GTP-binding protein
LLNTSSISGDVSVALLYSLFFSILLFSFFSPFYRLLAFCFFPEVDGVNVFAEILDTAGQDQYSALRKFFMPLGDVFVLVYDITQDFTFDEINPIKEEIFAANERHMQLPFILVGNKCDMDGDRVVTVEEGNSLCETLQKSGGVWHFMEASAKENINVNDMFRKAISEALRLQTNKSAGTGSGVMVSVILLYKEKRRRRCHCL